MNIGNSYSSWMHNTSRTGYESRSGQTGKTGAGKPFFGENGINDNDLINDAAAGETEEKGEEKKTEDMTYREQILAHMEEMAKKVKEGKVEPTFQTGAQSFTIKEWEKLLADFDDAEEALQEQIKDLIAEVEKQAAKEALRREAEGKPDSDGTGAIVTSVSVSEAAQPKAETGGSVANPQPAENGSATVPQTASTTAAVPGRKPWEIDGLDDNCTDVE
ncbi:MAG: hypothetical protein K2I53_14890, partial [Lachnospiraceae bacterium]|nr:hypothetical protein [Lachnospiraceae bacterium]